MNPTDMQAVVDQMRQVMYERHLDYIQFRLMDWIVELGPGYGFDETYCGAKVWYREAYPISYKEALSYKLYLYLCGEAEFPEFAWEPTP